MEGKAIDTGVLASDADVADTGDTSNMALYSSLLIASLLGGAYIALKS